MSGNQPQEEAQRASEHNSSIQQSTPDTDSGSIPSTRNQSDPALQQPFDQLSSTEERPREPNRAPQQLLDQLDAATSSLTLNNQQQILLHLLQSSDRTPSSLQIPEVSFDQERPETFDQNIPMHLEDSLSNVPSPRSSPSSEHSPIEPNIRAQLEEEGIYASMANTGNIVGSNDQWAALLESARAGSHRMSFNQKFKLFNGKNVSAFLNRYNLKGKENQATEDDKIKYLREHVTEEIWPKVRPLIQSQDWKIIELELRDYFRPLDSDENISPEERLERLSNSKPSLNDDIYDWLIEHRSACQELDPQGWKTSKFHNFNLINSMPAKRAEKTMERLGYRHTRDFANQGYEKVWDAFMVRVAASRDVRQSRKALQDSDIESAIKWSRRHLHDSDDSDDKPAAKSTKAYGKNTEPPRDRQMENLVNELGQLKIIVTQLTEQAKMNGPRRIEEKGNRSRRTRFSTNAVVQTPYYSEESSDQGSPESDSDYISVNALRRQDATCWYCSGSGHFLQDCKLRTYDESCKFFKWDEAGGLGHVGPRQVPVPPRITRRLSGIKTCIRKMVMLWAESFNVDGNVEMALKKAKIKAPAGFSWEATPAERDTIDRVKQQADMSIYSLPEPFILPPPSIMKRSNESTPSTNLLRFPNEDRMVTQCKIPQKDRKSEYLRHIEDIMRANTVTLSPDHSQQESGEETGSEVDQLLAVTAAEFGQRKRQRTEEENEDENQQTAVPRAQPLNNQDKEVEMINYNPAKNNNKNTALQKEQSVEATMLQSRSVLLNAVLENTVRIKTGVLLNAMPELAGELGNQLIATAQGITKTEFVEKVPLQKNGVTIGGVPATNVTAIKRAHPTKEEMLQRLGNAAKLAIATEDAHILANKDKGREVRACQIRINELKDLQRSIGTEDPFDQTKLQTVHDKEAVKVNVIKTEKLIKQVQELPMMQLKLDKPDGQLVEALLDSGSQGNIMSLSLAKDLGLTITPCNRVTHAYNKEEVQIVGETITPAYIGNAWMPVRIYIADSDVLEEFILGMPFFRAAQVSFDHGTENGNLYARCRIGDVQVITPVAGAIRWEHNTPKRASLPLK